MFVVRLRGRYKDLLCIPRPYRCTAFHSVLRHHYYIFVTSRDPMLTHDNHSLTCGSLLVGILHVGTEMQGHAPLIVVSCRAFSPP